MADTKYEKVWVQNIKGMLRGVQFTDEMRVACLREFEAFLSEAEKREARSPFEIVADWHDKQARTFKEMSHDWRSGEQGRKKAADAAKHHAGSAAALRLHALNKRRSDLQSEER